MHRASTTSWVIGALLGTSVSHAVVLTVPGDHPTIQGALDAGAPGDTVLVTPGMYAESGILLSDKNLTLGSLYLTTGDTTFVTQTVIDGGGSTILRIQGTSVDSTSIVGLTFRNGEDGILPTSQFVIEHCRIETCADGIDYESGSGGVCRNNVFEANTDDGIDCDHDVDIVIEHNRICNNEDDGIEIRLQDYSGPTVNYVIRWNIISGNGEDGIQLIDYEGLSDRVFVIERNLILNNAMAGLGCMSGGNSNENYEGASIPERIRLANNVIDGHSHGVAGGDSVTAVNNIIINSSVLGMKNVDGGSTVSHTCAWQNGTDFLDCNVDVATMVLADPELNPDYTLRPVSPCIDAGSPGCVDPDGTVCDLGVFYLDRATSDAPPRRTEPAAVLHPIRPNPFGAEARVIFEVETPETATLAIYDLRGRRVRVLMEQEPRGAGLHALVWDGRTERGLDAASGVYFCHLTTGATHQTRRLVLVRGTAR